jgi:hypothetical protein
LDDFRGRHGFFFDAFGGFFFFFFIRYTAGAGAGAGAGADAGSILQAGGGFPCFGGFFLSRYTSGTEPGSQIGPSGDESDTGLSGGGWATVLAVAGGGRCTCSRSAPAALRRTPQALQSVTGPIGPDLHRGVSAAPHCRHLLALFAGLSMAGEGVWGS